MVFGKREMERDSVESADEAAERGSVMLVVECECSLRR